jgi:hypothetical protein
MKCDLIYEDLESCFSLQNMHFDDDRIDQFSEITPKGESETSTIAEVGT